MFAAFGRRITRGYVLLACALIVLVVASTSALSFVLYARTLNDALASAAQRVADRVAQASQMHQTLAEVAPQLVGELGRGRLHVTVVDDARHVLAGSPDRPTGSERALSLVLGALDIRHERVAVPGGTVFISPDVGRFGTLLFGYWSVALPVGVVAVLLAWLLGRAITRRAVAPLEAVAAALADVGAEDARLEPIAGATGDLAPLTEAYNGLAFRLNAAAAERAENEARMRRFVADAGHELRTPLTVVMGYLDALQRGVATEPASVATIYATMMDESRRMRGLIEKLIFLARLDRQAPPAIEAFDAAASVRAVAAALAPIAADRIVVDAPAPAIAEGERTEIEEALRNLAENALKYAPRSPVRIGVAVDGEAVEIRVADDGPGIAAADQPHVFDRFYRGRARYDAEGTGLGLAIAKRAVERSGGSIALRSEAGAGTVFTIRLPAGTTAPGAATRAPR